MRRAPVVALALVALVVLSGCTALLEPTPTPTAPQGPTTTPAPQDGSPAPARANPWGESTLVVAVENRVNDSRDFEPLVQRALEYWSANSERYAGYHVDYRLDPDAEDPDLVVEFVPDIAECGSEREDAAGCAPYITKAAQVSRPERVQIEGGFSDESTVEVIKHELGHTLGLGHEDEPQDVMAAASVLTTLPRTDAVNQTYAWASPTLSVFVDLSAVPDRDRREVRRQVDETLAYFDRGAQGTVPEDVSFVRTDNRTAADVVIQVDGESPCQRDRGSCRFAEGLDPDGDRRLEQFSRLEVYVVGLDARATGWHVGRHLGYGLSVNTEEEYPPPLKESASYAERRSDWWEEG